jgi:hypothetical protein
MMAVKMADKIGGVETYGVTELLHMKFAPLFSDGRVDSNAIRIDY